MCGTSDFYDNTDALESYNWKEDGIQAEILQNFQKSSPVHFATVNTPTDPSVHIESKIRLVGNHPHN